MALVLGLGGCAQPQSLHSQRLPEPYRAPQAQSARPPMMLPQRPAYPVMQPQPAVAQMPLAPPQAQGKPQVAILLPLSGTHAELGQAMLNAAQLAVFDMAGQNFELMPRDTARLGAANAARDALSNGAKLIIGPLFAADVTAVKPIAQNANVNLLALSTDVTLAEPGIYVMGFTPGQQVERVVGYATERGLRKFAALIPNTAYGKLVGNAFQQAVTAQGGEVVLKAAPNAAGVQQVAATRDRIEALFLPLGGQEAQAITRQLQATGIDASQIRLLGTGLWDDASLANTDDLLTGGWYAAPDPAMREHFRQSYQKAYGAEPPRLATLAYDATALATILASRGGLFDRASLANPGGFTGADGLFRFTAAGTAERGLAVLEVTRGGGRVIAPAANSFAPFQRRY